MVHLLLIPVFNSVWSHILYFFGSNFLRLDNGLTFRKVVTVGCETQRFNHSCIDAEATFRSLNAIVAQLEKLPFGANTATEL